IAREVARAVTHKSADFGKFTQKIDGRKQIACRKRHDLHATIDEEWIGTASKGVAPILHERSKGRSDLAAFFGFENIDVPPIAPAAASVSSIILCVGTGFAGLTRSAIRVALGASSCSRLNRLALSSAAM